jgi:hypothetical protein
MNAEKLIPLDREAVGSTPVDDVAGIEKGHVSPSVPSSVQDGYQVQGGIPGSGRPGTIPASGAAAWDKSRPKAAKLATNSRLYKEVEDRLNALAGSIRVLPLRALESHAERECQ